MGTASPSKLECIRFGVFELDLRSRELRKQGVRVKLQEQPFQVLQVLLERPGEVVTREELRQRIWSSDTFVDFEGGMYNAVKKLREALGDTADTPRFIETLPRRGYRFIGAVSGNADAAFRYFTLESRSKPDLVWTREIVAELMSAVTPPVESTLDKTKPSVPVKLDMTFRMN